MLFIQSYFGTEANFLSIIIILKKYTLLKAQDKKETNKIKLLSFSLFIIIAI